MEGIELPQTTIKQYRRPMKAAWFLHNRHLVLFMIREITALFVAAYCVFLLAMLFRASQGPDAFHVFFESLKRPGAIAFHLVTLAFVAYHSWTWFMLTPKVVILWQGEEKVAPGIIIGLHLALWAAMSVLVVVLLWLV